MTASERIGQRDFSRIVRATPDAERPHSVTAVGAQVDAAREGLAVVEVTCVAAMDERAAPEVSNTYTIGVGVAPVHVRNRMMVGVGAGVACAHWSVAMVEGRHPTATWICACR